MNQGWHRFLKPKRDSDEKSQYDLGGFDRLGNRGQCSPANGISRVTRGRNGDKSLPLVFHEDGKYKCGREGGGGVRGRLLSPWGYG